MSFHYRTPLRITQLLIKINLCALHSYSTQWINCRCNCTGSGNSVTASQSRRVLLELHCKPALFFHFLSSLLTFYLCFFIYFNGKMLNTLKNELYIYSSQAELNFAFYARKLPLIFITLLFLSSPREGDDFSFVYCVSPFCFLLIELHCTFSISCKMLPYYVYYYCILIGMW